MKALQKFFSKQKFLIVDDGVTSRIAIARALVDLGVPASRMSLTGKFDAAREFAKDGDYTVLICEYELGKSCGLDLVRFLPSLTLTVIITKDQSETAEARSAEHDVDIFIKKPFTIDQLKSALVSHFRNVPSMKDGSLERSTPAIQGTIESARQSGIRSSQYDKIGYRALLGLYEGLVAEGAKADAYEVLRRLVQQFPIHPPRLLEVLRLAIETRNLAHIGDYYEIFLRLEDKNQELVKNVCAAMIIWAKEVLRAGDAAQAVDIFKKVAVTSGKNPAFLGMIIEALLEAGKNNEADAFLRQFGAAQRDTDDFLALDYRVFSSLRPLHEVLTRGQELLGRGARHPDIYKVLIAACKSAGHRAQAESLALDAGRLWPARSQEYSELLASV